MPKVSIIVPIYKVESYLRECIDSLINQTLVDIEIILVDDGSPDNCDTIADEYARRDSRVKVIHKENEGLGMARNSGLEVAVGDYIGFVDSDDWVEPDTYESLYVLATKNDFDIVKGCIFESRDVATDTRNIQNNTISKVYDGNKIKECLLQQIVGPADSRHVMQLFDVSVCSNIYKRYLIDKYRLRFKSERIYYGEDFLFNLIAFHRAETVLVTNKSFYHYRENNSSLTTVYRPTMNESVIRLHKLVEDYIKDTSLSSDYSLRNKLRLCNLTFNMIFNVCKLSNTITMQEKICKIQEIISMAEVKNAFEFFEVENVPIKWNMIFRSIKEGRSALLYFICTLRQVMAIPKRILT